MDEMSHLRRIRPHPPEPAPHTLQAGFDQLSHALLTTTGNHLASRRPSPGMLRMAAVGGLSVVAATGLLVSQTVNLGGGGGGPATQAQAAVVLHKAAAAAEKEESAEQHDTFAYVEYESSSWGSRRTNYSHVWMWNSRNGSRGGRYREYSTPPETHPELNTSWEAFPLPRNSDPDLSTPTHASLHSLPRDPEAMLDQLRAECRKVREFESKAVLRDGVAVHRPTGKDPVVKVLDRCDSWHKVFHIVQGIVMNHVVPPQTRATLFEATAQIPGITVVQNAKLPVTGERGVAVAFAHSGDREELVFDPETYELLGSRTVALEDTESYGAGTVLGSTAILEKGFVDELGERR